MAYNSEFVICDVKDQSNLDLGEIVTRPGRVARTIVTIRSESKSLETKWKAHVDSDSGVRLSKTSGVRSVRAWSSRIFFVRLTLSSYIENINYSTHLNIQRSNAYSNITKT